MWLLNGFLAEMHNAEDIMGPEMRAPMQVPAGHQFMQHKYSDYFLCLYSLYFGLVKWDVPAPEATITSC